MAISVGETFSDVDEVEGLQCDQIVRAELRDFRFERARIARLGAVEAAVSGNAGVPAVRKDADSGKTGRQAETGERQLAHTAVRPPRIVLRVLRAAACPMILCVVIEFARDKVLQSPNLIENPANSVLPFRTLRP